MRIYVDTCVWHRPFDGRGDERVSLEADAMIQLMESVERQESCLISSEVLEFEVFRGSWSDERAIIVEGLALAGMVVVLDDSIRARAIEFESLGIAAMDSLHLASAESGRADLFVTCDHRLLRRAARCNDLTVQVVDPLTALKRTIHES